MKVYGNIFCADYNQSLPAWVAVRLSPMDESNIKRAQYLLDNDEQMHSVAYPLQGEFEDEGADPFHEATLYVSRSICKLVLHHQYMNDIAIDLDYPESTEYKWNGEEVVEV